nr:acyltransferase [uncultured Duganella sp.]
MNHRKNLDWIQLLRGVAALLVVLTHARYALLGTAAYPLADQWLGPGAMGVDLFFIISGFIMCYTTAGSGGGAEAARFAIKRFARVWPVYALVTLVAVFVLYDGYLHAADQRRALWHTLAMVPADPRHAPYFGMSLPVAWTLAFEMYFYLVYAAAMLLPRWRGLALTAWVVLTVLVLPGMDASPAMGVERDLGYRVGYLAIVTNPFVLEFLAGVGIGWLYLQDWARLRSHALAWHLLGLAVAFAGWSVYGGLGITHGPSGYGWPLALLVLAMALASKTVEIHVPSPLLWLGSISYSLYLTHLLAQKITFNALTTLGKQQLYPTWGYVFLSTALALSLAALSQRYLEQGLSSLVRRWLLKLVPGRPAPARAAGAGARA